MNSDSELQRDVQEQLASVSADQVEAQVTEGVVTLTGMVHNDVEKWAVEASIRYLRGVRGLVNQTIVDPGSSTRQPDADIARRWFS